MTRKQRLGLGLVFFFVTCINGEIKDSLKMSDSVRVDVDTTLVMVVDVTGDNVTDTIRCYYSAQTWEKPITVTYTIYSGSKLILNETYTNEMFDDEFGTSDMDGACTTSYLECKKQWYFNELPNRLIKTAVPGTEKHHNLLDKSTDYSIPTTLYQFYRDSLDYKKSKANEKINQYRKTLLPRNITLVEIPVTLKYFTFPRIYDPQSNSFIMIMGY